MSDPVSLTYHPHDHDVWHLATPAQLLRFIKLCGVEGRVMAAWLGVHPPAVSMWLHGKRPVPDRYRPALLTWAGRAQAQALQQLEIDKKAQPTDALRTAVIQAFFAPWQQWRLEVQYEAGTFARRLRWECQWLGTYATKEDITETDLDSIENLCLTVLNKVEIMRAMQQEATGEDHEARPEEEPQA